MHLESTHQLLAKEKNTNRRGLESTELAVGTGAMI